MSQESWQDFAKLVEDKLQQQCPNQPIADAASLNKQWNILSNAILQAANRTIPTTHTAPHTFHAHSLQATKLHLALKQINSAIYICKNTYPPTSFSYLTQIINDKIIKASTTLPEPITTLTANLTIETILKHLKETAKMIWRSRKIESEQAQQDKIQYYINQRYEDFQTNTTRMIDSILHRRAECINFKKIIKPDQVLTDPIEIKEAARTHFQNWTKTNTTNDN